MAPEIELEGLDLTEMGSYGYPDFQINKSELDFNATDNAEVKQLRNLKNIFAKKA